MPDKGYLLEFHIVIPSGKSFSIIWYITQHPLHKPSQNAMSNKRWSPPAEHVCVFLTDSDNEILQSICPDASAARKQAFKKKKKKQ